LGFIRKSDNGKCIVDKQMNGTSVSTSSSSTKSTSISSLFDIDVNAGDDQTIVLPINQIELYGHVLYKSNKSEIDISVLNSQNLNLLWSLKSATNGAKVEISNQEGSASHIVVKQLREGTYEFEFKLNDKQGITLASDTVKIEVLSGKKSVLTSLEVL
jgi:hypothetical protein